MGRLAKRCKTLTRIFMVKFLTEKFLKLRYTNIRNHKKPAPIAHCHRLFNFSILTFISSSTSCTIWLSMAASPT